MATISKRVTQDGEVRYLAQVRLKGHPPQNRTFERKTDAMRWAHQVETDIRAGRNKGQSVRKPHTLAELIETYITQELPSKPAVEALYRRHLEWWREELGAYYVSDLSSERIEESYRRLLREPGATGKMRSVTTANRYLLSLGS